MFSLTLDEKTDLVMLHRSLAGGYLELVQAHRDDLAQWLPWPTLCTQLEHFEAFIQRSLHAYADGTALLCGIRHQGQLIGTAGFNSLQRELSKGEIGYWISPEFRRRGIVRAVCRRLIQYGFETLGLEKIELAAATGNQPSRTLAESLGFQLEGVITRAENLRGQILDHAKYGLLRPQ